MANVDVDFSGLTDLCQQVEQLNNPQSKQACVEECADSLAQVYLAEAIKNTPTGGAKAFGVTEKAYRKINATEVGASYFKQARARNGNASRIVKRIKKSRKQGKQYLVLTASEHMKRSWGASEVRKVGGEYMVQVFNSASYASYVNDGHRQTPGLFVPALGKRLVKNWVDGKFITEKAETHTKRVSRKLIQQIILSYLERGLR